MKALCWHGKTTSAATAFPIPKIEHPRDAIIKVTSCAICGSDLHLYDGFMPGMKSGDIMGHEFMGEVVEVGSDNKKLKVGDRVVVPFTISCGECEQCQRGNFSVCERTNRNKRLADKSFGHATAGLFGYTHLTGGYAGGQAEYVRVPYADVDADQDPDGLTDEQVLFLGDIFPTGWQAAVHCDIQPTDTVADLGLRPGRPVRHPQRRSCSAPSRSSPSTTCRSGWPWRSAAGAITINFDEESVVDRLNELTAARARRSASTPSAWRPTPPPRSTPCTTGSSRR